MALLQLQSATSQNIISSNSVAEAYCQSILNKRNKLF